MAAATDGTPGSPIRIGEILDRMEAAAEGRDPSVGDLISASDDMGFLTAMMVPALLVVSPLSGIPLFSSLCGITIAIIASQMLLGRKHLWLPGAILRRRVKSSRLKPSLAWLRRGVNWLDSKTRRRLWLFVAPPVSLVLRVLPIPAGLAMPFLEALPFSSSLLGASVLCFSVALLSRDGLFAVAGFVFVGVAATVPLFVLRQIAEFAA